MTLAVPMADPTAVMGRRIVAYLIDGVIGLILLVAIVAPLVGNKLDRSEFRSNAAATDYCGEVNDNTLNSLEDTNSEFGNRNTLPADSRFCVAVGSTAYLFTGEDGNSLLGQLTIFSYLTGGLNTIILQGLTGATVGKFLMGIRTVKEDGTRAGIGWNILRQLVGVVDAFCCGIVGLLVATNSKGHRRVGDMAASTYVVHKSAMGAPISVPGVTPSAAAYPYAAAPTGWPQAPGAPQAGGTWSPAADPTQVAPSADGPTWDPVRNAYIQYDREVGAWVQWNDNVKAWHPIDQ